MSQSMKEMDWKGAVKPCRVPAAEQNEQSGLNCTGWGPSTPGRATAESMVRQRSMRRNPLYLVHHSRMFDGTESLRSDPVWLDVPNWLARNTCQMMGHSLYPAIQNRQGKSMPPTDSWVGNRNMGTCPTRPPRKRASRGDRR